MIATAQRIQPQKDNIVDHGTKDTTTKRPTWLTTAQRIQPRKGQHGCIAALLPTGKLSGPSRQTEWSEQEGERQKYPGSRTDLGANAMNGTPSITRQDIFPGHLEDHPISRFDGLSQAAARVLYTLTTFAIHASATASGWLL